MQKLLNPRFWLVWTGLAFAAVIALLVFTPIAWELGGRQPESYPELWYFAFGVPPALIMIFSGIVVAIFGYGGKRGIFRSSLLPLWSAVLITVVLAALILTPAFEFIPRDMQQTFIDITFYVGWPLLFLWAAAASVWVWRIQSSRKPFDNG